MKILALETSSAATSIAVAVDGQITDVRRFAAPRGRGAEIFTVLEELRPAWTGLERMAIGLGPGSYNGLRTACALAGSFQMVLGIELVTAPSCCLLDVEDPSYIAIGDARGGRIWKASVEDRQLVGEISLHALDEAADLLRGTGQAIYRVGDVRGFEQLPSAHPDAAVLAVLAKRLAATDPRKLEPLYLKPPHITAPREGRP
ncbi:MAG: tRNA (adenosine(37)-N6)-threonylcarbamoyltransferase complex dimerization subunit type 1 TsaB [Chthoniobacterales bacterium]